MVAHSDVALAFRMFLGREVSDPAVLEQFAHAYDTVEALGHAFATCEEFQSRQPAGQRPRYRPEPGEPGVDTRAAPPVLDAMIRHVEASWTKLGEDEPHWSVVTAERFKAAAIGGNEAEFFASGRPDVIAMRAALERNGIDPAGLHHLFELGCGLGRLTLWLSEMFAEVTAADISDSHLRIARETLATAGRRNVRLLHLDHVQRLDELPAFDAFFSILVLQHNPPPVMRAMLTGILGKLRPGGAAYFQVPTAMRDYRFSSEGYAETRVGTMEMHAFPQRDLFELFRALNCDLLEIGDDTATDAYMVSNTILLRKRG